MWGSSFNRFRGIARPGRFRAVALFALCFLGAPGPSSAQEGATPLEFLKAAELRYRHERGEVYLGKVMTLTYPASKRQPGDKYRPLLLELTDVLKTPLRENYRLVLKGYSDATGSPEQNQALSRKRAETLKEILVRQYYMNGARITAEGFGETNPVAPNQTPEGRRLNRRVEIHVWGDVSQAVRHMDKQEERR